MADKPKEQNTESRIVKCGKRTYFFDLKDASNGSKYLKITESRFVKEGEDRRRNTFILFREDMEKFTEVLQEASKDLEADNSA